MNRNHSARTVNIAFASQENLRGKLEQLSAMYEEVSARMENLETAYAQAENEVRCGGTAAVEARYSIIVLVFIQMFTWCRLVTAVFTHKQTSSRWGRGPVALVSSHFEMTICYSQIEGSRYSPRRYQPRTFDGQFSTPKTLCIGSRLIA